MIIKIISATQYVEKDFWEKSALGQSLIRLRFDARIESKIAFSNKRGLGHVYNSQIMVAGVDDILVFVHDDVWLEDLFLAQRLHEGLSAFNVIGVAGNKKRGSYQPVWSHFFRFSEDDKKTPCGFVADDASNWSGAIGSSTDDGKPFGRVMPFGAVPASCELLDGVFLAAKRSTLVKNSVFFDPQFEFHFYDLDFCRTARKRGLTLGTWPISITHLGTGLYGTESWNAMKNLYFEKWGD
jgi:GT2 family glycosyltransferase